LTRGQGRPWPHNPFGLWGLGEELEALVLRLPERVEEAIFPIALGIERDKLILLKPLNLSEFLIDFSLAILKRELDLSGERGERGELRVRERGRGRFFDGGDEGEDVSGINHAQMYRIPEKSAIKIKNNSHAKRKVFAFVRNSG
jgi:hypothetical protein